MSSCSGASSGSPGRWRRRATSCVPPRSRLPDRWLALGLAAVLGLGCLCGYRFGSRYPMDWQPRDAAETQETEAIRDHLLSLGFPEDVLRDLSAEDLAACGGAMQVIVDTIDLPMNPGREVVTHYGNSLNYRTVYDVKELHVTGVGVEVPGERDTWILFHHFRWQVDPACRGTEALQLWLAGREDRGGWDMAGPITGRLLCDRDGQTFTAPYAYLGCPSEARSYEAYAAFSLPQEGEDCRGYLCYPVTAREGVSGFGSILHYTHQTSWRQYPARTAMAERMRNSWLGSEAFRTQGASLQAYLGLDGVLHLD